MHDLIHICKIHIFWSEVSFVIFLEKKFYCLQFLYSWDFSLQGVHSSFNDPESDSRTNWKSYLLGLSSNGGTPRPPPQVRAWGRGGYLPRATCPP